MTCTNDPPCGHYWHDIYEPGDPYPTCCTEGCRCGHPGEAILRNHDDGTITVVRADPVIRVSTDVLDDMVSRSSPRWDPGTMTLVLDTAGEYRYGYLRQDPKQRRVLIFGREKS